MATRLRELPGFPELAGFLFQLLDLLLQAISHGCQLLDPCEHFALLRR